MPSQRKTSTRAGIHHYLRQDFVWPDLDDGIKALTEQEISERLVKARKKRTFYFSPSLSNRLGIDYDNPGLVEALNKNVVYENSIVNQWNHDQLKRWNSLEDENGKIVLKNIGMGWWLAETIWIKAK